MSRICIFNGLHDGTEVTLPAGPTIAGSGAASNLILLDDGIPDHLLTVCVDEEDRVILQWLSPDANVLDGNGQSVSVTTPFDLSAASSDGGQLSWQICIAGISVALYCDPPASVTATLSGATSTGAAASVASGNGLYIPAFLARRPVLKRLWLRVAGSAVFSTPRRRYGLAACAALLLVASFYAAVKSSMPAAQQDVQAQTLPLFDSLRLTRSLSLGHQPPAMAREGLLDHFDLLDDKSLQKEAASEGVTQSAGRDFSDSRGLKLSTDLTTGLAVRRGDAVTEQVVAFFQERAQQSPWVSRMVFNTHGSKVIARGVLSESERLDFERLLSLVVREYGQQVSFRVAIDPLESPVQLQVKQVVGGSTPVAILEDGSRLTPGSYYEGRLVESITVERIVLRGKDRLEIPI